MAMKSKSTFFITAVIGVILAVGFILLFTTKNGKQIRRRASAKGRQIMGDLKNKSCCEIG